MSREYDLYLEEHKGNVAKGFYWIRENMPELLIDSHIVPYESQICFEHDASKSELDEYFAYDAYFYGGNRSYQVVQDFNKAWLLHVHRNPHHWQYFCLIQDDPGSEMIILDMPYNYILEMICDWMSFSFAKGDLYEIFNWYDDHKDHIKLSDKTRKLVDNILGKIHDKLDELKVVEEKEV